MSLESIGVYGKSQSQKVPGQKGLRTERDWKTEKFGDCGFSPTLGTGGLRTGLNCDNPSPEQTGWSFIPSPLLGNRVDQTRIPFTAYLAHCQTGAGWRKLHSFHFFQKISMRGPSQPFPLSPHSFNFNWFSHIKDHKTQKLDLVPPWNPHWSLRLWSHVFAKQPNLLLFLFYTSFNTTFNIYLSRRHLVMAPLQSEVPKI